MTRTLVFMLVASLFFSACGGESSTDPCEGINCSGHGTCNDSSGKAVCVCVAGYTGVACDTCDTGYQDNDGNDTCMANCAASGLGCGIHGACDDSSGATVCGCDTGYSGAACEACDTGFQDNDGNNTCLPSCVTSGLDCGSHGNCDDRSGVSLCSCDTGWAGQRCEACAGGYHNEGGDCIQDTSCQADTCSGQGNWDDTTGVSICTCNEGYTGDHCESCDTGYQDNNGDGTCLADCATMGLDCGLYGTCDDSGGVAICRCNEGYTGEQCGECASGYHYEGGVCVQDQLCQENTCAGHGICDDTSGVPICTCETGYAGDHCESCASEYQDNDGDGSCLPDCTNQTCSGHGTCDDMSGEAICSCDEGWVGPDCSVEEIGVEWVAIPGGTFMMGSNSGNLDERPVHQVSVTSFEMTKTEVTVGQFQACVVTGECSEPFVGGSCNWGQAGREEHPVNCVDWFQAVDFCEFTGGRLPSEAEWEYAARGGGQDITYPWGDEEATCEYAVMLDMGDVSGCGLDRTWAVCSKTTGNTEQGLCDMAGNVYEWVQDWYHNTYDGAPSDGSAWESPSGSLRVLRGGAFVSGYGPLRASYRLFYGPSVLINVLGLRCAR